MPLLILSHAHAFPESSLADAMIAAGFSAIAEASLFFLGLRQQPPAPREPMLNAARNSLDQTIRWRHWRGIEIFLIVLGCNLLDEVLHEGSITMNKKEAEVP